MTMTLDQTDRDAALQEWASGFGPVLAENAERHDRDGTWVQESYDHLRENGVLALAVPAELGGMGATIGETAIVMRELAQHCGSTALAMSMHQHVTAFTAWRYRRELPGAEATLRRVAEDRIVLVSTGGADFTAPRGEAVKVDGGYKRERAQDLRQPVARRDGDVDDVPVQRSRARACGCSTWPCRSAPASRCTTPGTRWACAARRATT